MFLISGNSSTAYSILDRNSTIRTDEKVTKIPVGCVDDQKSLCQLLDCSVLYYYAVAHKYVVMVSCRHFILGWVMVVAFYLF